MWGAENVCPNTVTWCHLDLISFVHQDGESNKRRKSCKDVCFTLDQTYPDSEAGSDGCRLLSVAERALN